MLKPISRLQKKTIRLDRLAQYRGKGLFEYNEELNPFNTEWFDNHSPREILITDMINKAGEVCLKIDVNSYDRYLYIKIDDPSFDYLVNDLKLD